MRQALTEALIDFSALVVVSHDRHLIRSTAFLSGSRQKVEPFDGDTEDYQQWLEACETEKRADDAPKEEATPAALSHARSKRREAELRTLTQPLRKGTRLEKDGKAQQLARAEEAWRQRLYDPSRKAR